MKLSPSTGEGKNNVLEAAAHVPDLEQHLAFLELTEDDKQRLHTLRPLLFRWGSAFVEEFYRHLFAFEETAVFLRDPALVARLKQAQQAHLESMLDAQWDEAYVARRRRGGDAHAQVGINPQMFLGAYNQYLQFCFRQLATDKASGSQVPEQI